jgi:hypothetical protein
MDLNDYTLMNGISSELITQPRNKSAISLSCIFDTIDFIQFLITLEVHFKDHPTSTIIEEPRIAKAIQRLEFEKGRLEVALKDVSQMCVHLFFVVLCYVR